MGEGGGGGLAQGLGGRGGGGSKPPPKKFVCLRNRPPVLGPRHFCPEVGVLMRVDPSAGASNDPPPPALRGYLPAHLLGDQVKQSNSRAS